MTPNAPDSGPVYVFPVRALRRWSTENLTLETAPAGGLVAHFRFEGSTCGNVPFELRYQVLLDGSAQRIIAAQQCTPAPFDEGHQRMCCWQEDAARAATLLEEKPLAGQPLAAVLSWRPLRSPSGCLCAPASRHHKWQAVLETLHFALFASPTPTVSP